MIAQHLHGNIHEIRLDRPPVNALNPELLAALRDALTAAPAKGAKGIIISGGAKVFSGGMDVPHLMTLERPLLEAAWRTFFEVLQALANSPVPVVAAIAGHNPAGGCVLALCCDYRIMTRGPFKIGLNEVQVGLIVPEGIQHLLRRVVGRYRAERLLIAGAMVEADTAHSIGLVDELVEPGQVVARAVAWLKELLQLPNEAMLATRALARADLVAAVSDPARIGLDRFFDAWHAPHTQAALRALVARLGK